MLSRGPLQIQYLRRTSKTGNLMLEIQTKVEEKCRKIMIHRAPLSTELTKEDMQLIGVRLDQSTMQMQILDSSKEHTIMIQCTTDQVSHNPALESTLFKVNMTCKMLNSK